LKNQISRPNPAKTIILIMVALTVLYFKLNLKWVLNLSIIFGLLAFFSNYFTKKVDFFWMKIGWILGLVVPNLVLTFVYYFFLTPISFLAKKIDKKNQMQIINNKTSMFNNCNKIFDKEFFKKSW
jgi:hypothetical protein